MAANGDDTSRQSLNVESGLCFNVIRESVLTQQQLDEVLHAVCSLKHVFRPFGGRYSLDFKLAGEPNVELQPPYDCMNPLLHALVKAAQVSLQVDERLALLQVIVNLFTSKSSSVKPHRHQCRQICASLGETYTVDVDGRAIQMQHGDCLPLNSELHSVPQNPCRVKPRVSICLFYGSRWNIPSRRSE